MFIIKKVFTIIIIILSIIIVGFLFYNIYHSDQNTLIRYNTYLQMSYIILTAILVTLTYFALRGTQLQKHQATRPYVIFNAISIYHYSNCKTLNFSLYNEGIGLALKLNVEIRSKKNNKLLFSKKYTRLAIKESPIYDVLGDINNSLNNGGNVTTIYQGNSIVEEIGITEDIENYYELEVIVYYQDIYGKKYKGFFVYKYDKKDTVYKLQEEKIDEV